MPSGKCVFLGNKSDLVNDREIPYEEIKEYTNDNLYYEVSAKTGNNISLAFESLAYNIQEKQIEEENNPDKVIRGIEGRKTTDLKEYNEKHTKETNMNKIKAILHNRVLYQMVHDEKVKYDYIMGDEFARENRYYEYLNDQPVIQKDITFLTKAEDISPAVAFASIISRYLFLQEFDKLCDSIHIPLPKGAGKDVDEIGEEVVEKYGEEKLKEIAKVNFK